MGSTFEVISDEIAGWISQQSMFFVATAPLESDGHVNVSPKGEIETFTVLGEREVAYVDLFGSGIETVAHLKENGRIVIMFCAFAGAPKVVRLHGRGEVIEQRDRRYDELLERFELDDEMSAAARAAVRVDVTRISDSCGFGVPLMDYQRERRQLFKTAAAWVRKNGPTAIRDYCNRNNSESVDGLPGLEPFEDALASRAHSHDGRKL